MVKMPSDQRNDENAPRELHFGQNQNIDFHPSKICPRNFIIFDRTDNRSQIMYHPRTAEMQNDVYAPREVDSVMKEDSGDIDLLLSFEDGEEEEDEEEEEEVSTARTHGNDSDTADSCSSKLPGSGTGRGLGLSLASCKSSGISDSKKRCELKKMVDLLRGIVPGTGTGSKSKKMNTVDVLDEAVKYLKSLKVEMQKVGVANLED